MGIETSAEAFTTNNETSTKRPESRFVEHVELPFEQSNLQKEVTFPNKKETCFSGVEDYTEKVEGKEDEDDEESKGILKAVEKIADWAEEKVWPLIKNNVPSVIRVGIGSVIVIAGIIITPLPLPFGLPLIALGLSVSIGPKNAVRLMKKSWRKTRNFFSKKK